MATADAAAGTVATRRMPQEEILKGIVGKIEIEAVKTETADAEAVATTTPIRQVHAAALALTGKTVLGLTAVQGRRQIARVGATATTTRPDLEADGEQIGRTRPDHAEATERLLIAVGEIGTITRQAHVVAPAQIGRTHPDHEAVPAPRQVGMVMTDEGTIAGAVEIIEIGIGAMIAVTETVGATIAITRIVGVMRHGIRVGATTTTTTVVTGIRTGTIMAGTTVGAGT